MKFLEDDEDQLNLDEPKTTDDLQDVEPQSKMKELLDSNIDDSETALENEANANEDLGAQLSKDDESEIADEPKQSSQLEQFQNFLQQYKQLQDNRRKSDLVAGLAAAGGKIGQSMAGKYSGKFDPDMTGYNIIKQMGERPVSDFEQAQVLAGRQQQLQQSPSIDANSSQSKLIRDYLNKKVFKDLGMQLGPEVSASDAMMLLKTGVAKPQATHFQQLPMVNQQTGAKTMAIFNPTSGGFVSMDGQTLGPGWVRDYRAQTFVDPFTQERMGFSGGTGKATGPLTGPGVNRPGAEPSDNGQPSELSRTMLTAQQSKQLDHTRDHFLKEVKDDRGAVNASDRVLQVLESGQQFGDLPAELQDQMSRSFGQKGHITDASMSRILGRSDWQSRMNLSWNLLTQGKIDDENREFLKEVMTVIRDQNQTFIKNKAKVYAANLAKDFKSSPNLKNANITPESIMNLVGTEEAAASSTQQKKDPKIQDYAKKYFNNNYDAAKAHLVGKGYKPQE